MNKYLDTIVVCPLTSKLHHKWRNRIQITCNNGKSEIAVIPLLLSCYYTAVVFSILNLIILHRRIRIEEKALKI